MKYVVGSLGGAVGGDAWNAAVSQTYFPLDTEYRSRPEFTGTLECWSLGVVGVSRNTCDGILYRRHRRHFLNERDSSLLVTIPEVDEVQFSQGSHSTRCRPGGFLIERGDAPYEFAQARRNALWVLKVPTASVRARVGTAERLGARSFDATQGVAALFLDTLRITAPRVGELDQAAREAAGRHLLEMICLSILSDDRVLDSAHSTIRAGHLQRAEQFIRDRLKDPDLGPQAVAEAGGISLRYLQGLFRDAGTSVHAYIRDCRLDRCAEDLAEAANPRSIAEIGYRWGFSDQSHFSKQFRARFGRTPGDARRAAACAAPVREA